MKCRFAILLSILLSCLARTQAQTFYPPITPAVCNAPYRIVVIGSSTAWGTGATPIDSSWVRKLARYVNLQNSQATVVNLALPGYTTYHLMPTGFVPPPNRPFPVDVTHNITTAMGLQPDAIIINLPSNDIGLGVTVAEVKANFDVMVALAASSNVPVWVTTTQPRNTLSPNERLMQLELKNWIMQHYGNKAVDFWTDIANSDNTINSLYTYNDDNVHVNNAGHHLFYTRMVAEKIWDSICLRKGLNIPLPVSLVQFKATYNGVAAELSWETASEQNSQHFEIQRSADGALFTAIGTVAAAGNGTSSKSYAFTDGLPNNGNNYYRLKMVDIDGRFKYSVVILVKSNDSKKRVNVYPNPVNDNLQIAWNNMERGTYTVDVLLPTGQLLKSYRIGINGPYQVVSINRESNWKTGIYLLRISNSNRNAITQKLILE
jgi:lysophospholipase L1-like esterase